MSDIRTALTRKFGPLPAWAWALIAGAALYAYRSRKGTATPASTDATSPSTSDQTAGLKDPLTLAPGESVYDPNTGHLVGGAPEQQVPGAGATPQTPITLQPGETLYDPNTGKLIGGSSTSDPVLSANHTGRPVKVKKPAKRTVKAKPQHAHTKAARQPSNAKSKPRVAKLVGKRVSQKFKPGRPTVKARAAVGHPAAMLRGHAAPTAHTAMRQRPAAPHVTHPATQRTAPHPARAANPPPPRHPAPAPRKRRK